MRSTARGLVSVSAALFLMCTGYAHPVQTSPQEKAQVERVPVLLSDEQLALFWGGITQGKCRLVTGASAYGCTGIDSSCTGAGACPGGNCSECNPIIRNSECFTGAGATGTTCVGIRTLKCNAQMPVVLSGTCASTPTGSCVCSAQSGSPGCGTFAGCP